MIRMGRITQLVLGCCVLVCLIPGVLAFTASTMTVTPSGTINPNNAVNISTIVYAASGVAFSSYDDLQVITELDDPKWSYTIVVNGVENIRPTEGTKTLTISGFELAYKDQDEVLVKITLNARVPASAPMGTTKTLIKIQELDSRGYAIPSSVVTLDHLIGEPTPTPTPAYGRISVLSTPTGANVYLDNAYKGLTPLNVDAIPNGNHAVVLRLEGYEDVSRTVIVMGDSPTLSVELMSVPTVTMTVATTKSLQVTGTAQPGTTLPGSGSEYGSLTITTSPPGALVYIDGEIKGVTPATIPGLSAGSHSILLTMFGYQNLSTTIPVTAGESSEYSTGLSTIKKTPGFDVVVAVLSIAIICAYRVSRKYSARS